MTIGQVMAVVYSIVFGAAGLWAAILICGLLLSRRTTRAAAALELRPGKLALGGLLVGAIGIGGGLVMLNLKGIFVIVGWALLAGTLVLSLIGSAALAQLAGRRIQQLDDTRSSFTALWRGAGMLVLAGLIPAIGWFVLFPIMLLLSLGAGMTALTRDKTPALAAEAQSAL
ncbi:MAG: hypothetical protein QM758_26530 [Armatimonas sp.]